MTWTIALIVFIAQLLCCVFLDGKYRKYLPTLIVAGVMSVTVLHGNLTVMDLALLAAQTLSIIMGGLAIALYHVALAIKNRK